MGYLLLAIALFAGATKGFCGKKTSGYLTGFNDAILASTIRMALCILVGFILVLAQGEFSQLAPSGEMLLISALSGVSTAVFVVTWLICVKKSAYMMLDIFLMLGVLIPLIACNIFFGESIKWTQWGGIGILFIAVLIMCSYNNSIKTSLTVPSFLLLLVCGIANGVTDFSQKLYAIRLSGSSAAVFNFYTYVFTALTLVIAYLILRKKGSNQGEKADFKKIFFFIFIMSVCLFANSYFKTLAAERLSAVLLYPLNSGCALIVSALMAMVFFKEKITLKAVLGMLTAFVGLLVINVL